MEFVCKKVLAHRARLAALLERGDIYYDAATAEQAVAWIEGNIRHWKNPFAGQPFVLSEWQREDIVKPLFGYKWRDTGLRVFREVYLQLARKGGKSSLAAAILLCLLFCGGSGSELYCAATKKDQARIIFEDCRKFVRNSPALKRRAKIMTWEIQVPGNDSTLKPLSADENSLDGLNVSAASIDELHKHKSAYVHDVIVTGTGSRTQPLVLNTTTAGDNLEGVCYTLYEKAERVLAGEEDAPGFFCYIAEADPEDDWRSEAAYRKANPNYPVTPNAGYIRGEMQKAISQPAYRKTFFKYTLNRWVQTGGVTWLDYEKWRACGAEFCEEDLWGCNAWLGADLSKTTDLTALALIVELTERRIRTHTDEHGQTRTRILEPGLYLLVWNYLPAQRIEDVDEKEAPYKLWVAQGHITPCGGESIDEDVLCEKVSELCGNFRVQGVGVDRNRSAALIKHLEAECGQEVQLINQGMAHISETCKNFEKLVREVGIWHANNPCLNWQARVVLVKGTGDMIKPVKEYASSGKRIDAIYAAVDALAAREQGLAGVTKVLAYSGFGA